MQKKITGLFFTFLVAALLSGCTAIGDIFKGGVWVGIILVLVVLGIVALIFSKVGGKD